MRANATCLMAFVTVLTLGPVRAELLTTPVVREGADAIRLDAKMTCGTTEQGVTRYGMWEGKLYSRVPAEKDRHLFDVVGINTRQCAQLNDPVRGPGFRSVSREIMVYLDPRTHEIIDRWENPWTGQTIDVIHVANDPVNMRQPSYARDAAGKPARTELREYGDVLVSSHEVPLFYTNPLAGDYQAYVGGAYHAMEIFNTFYPRADLLNDKARRIGDPHLAWQRVSSWLPWMQMADRPGLMIFNATGFSTFDSARIPPILRRVLDERYPEYLVPPPIDDARPNETTWTVTKKAIDAQRAAGAKAP